MKHKPKVKIFAKEQRGAFLPVILISSVLFIALASALITIAFANIKGAKRHERVVSTLQVAEAGINYYMWHLSHDSSDFCDGGSCVGTGTYGPYIHEYRNQANQVIGSYEIFITPPLPGESVTSVKSIGRLEGTNTSRTIIAEIGMPSFARYQYLTNTETWVKSGEIASGPIHSNVGLRFDGTAQAIVSASSIEYRPSAQYGGDGQVKDGVWGNGGPTGYWVFSVPRIDFNGVSADLNSLREKAVADGIMLEDSGGLGFHLNFKNDGTVDIGIVKRERAVGITVENIQNYQIPENKLIFSNEDLWVEGTLNNQKVTVAAEKTGNQEAKIKVPNNLIYSIKDGSSSLGLIAEGDIEVPTYAPNNLEINAAMLAQKGHVWFENSNSALKNSITIYGSVSSNLFHTWYWTDNHNNIIAGYATKNHTFDEYLTLNPPPHFPTTGSYAILTWREE